MLRLFISIVFLCSGISAKSFKKNDNRHFRAIYSLKKFHIMVLKASPEEVDYKCGALVGHWDNGTPIVKGSGSFAGCYIGLPGPGLRHLIIIRWDEEGAKALIHEMHHAAGFSSDDTDKIDWDIPRPEDGV